VLELGVVVVETSRFSCKLRRARSCTDLRRASRFSRAAWRRRWTSSWLVRTVGGSESVSVEVALLLLPSHTDGQLLPWYLLFADCDPEFL
jgi:hypothetical protein